MPRLSHILPAALWLAALSPAVADLTLASGSAGDTRWESFQEPASSR